MHWKWMYYNIFRPSRKSIRVNNINSNIFSYATVRSFLMTDGALFILYYAKYALNSL